jgi:hypothetical protein
MSEWVFLNKYTEAIRASIKPPSELTDEELLADAILEYEKHTGKKYDDNSRNPRR